MRHGGYWVQDDDQQTVKNGRGRRRSCQHTSFFGFAHFFIAEFPQGVDDVYKCNATPAHSRMRGKEPGYETKEGGRG